MGKLGFELEILADYLFDEMKGERIFADETTLPTLAPRSRIDEDSLALGLCQG